MKKIFFQLSTSIVILFLSTNIVSAGKYSVSQSAQLCSENTKKGFDLRTIQLTKFLNKYNSPLTDNANTFIALADKYDLDYRLVPSITGVESTFGKRIPYGSFNAYGWANGKYYFNSWEESIEIVSKTLREKYYDRGAENITKIARRYAPPSSTWARNVKFFMNKIDKVPVEFDL